MPIKISDELLETNLSSRATSETNDVKGHPFKLNNINDKCTFLKNAVTVLNGLEDSYKQNLKLIPEDFLKDAKVKVNLDYVKNQCQNSSIRDENKKLNID